MSDLIYQFSQQAWPGQLTQLGAALRGGIDRRRAAAAEAERLANYTSLLEQYQETQDPSLLIQMQDVAPEKFEGFQKAWDMKDEIERKNIVQSNMEVLGNIYAGNDEMAAEKLAVMARASREAGNEGDAALLQQLSRDVLAGKGAQVAQNLGIITGTSPEGQEAMQNLFAQRGELRSQTAQEAELLEQGYKMDNISPEMRGQMIQRAKDAGYSVDTVEKVFALANNLGALGDMSPKDIVDAYLPIEKEYNDLALPYEETISNVQAINDSAFLDTGAADQAMVALFNKVLDPESVVRQSEVDATLNAAGTLSQVRTIFDRFLEGEILDPAARKRLVEAVNLIGNNSKGRLINIQEDIGQLVDEAGLKRGVIFKTAGTPEEVELNRARMLIKSQWGADDPDFDFDNASLEELRAAYPKTFEKISGGTPTATGSTPAFEEAPF